MIEKENYMQFEVLNQHQGIVHLFTKKPFDFRTAKVGDQEIKKQYQKIEQLLNCSSKKILKPLQTHSAVVKKVERSNLDESFESVDGLLTNLKQVALVTSVADCQSILLYDPVKQVIGNIHSGWRGTLNRILTKAILLMEQDYQCRAETIEVYFCPSILTCCFEVDLDVKEAFVAAFPDIGLSSLITKKAKDTKYLIDLVGINLALLKVLGISESNIVTSNYCTKCHSDHLHSYRASKDASGRNISFLMLTE